MVSKCPSVPGCPKKAGAGQVLVGAPLLGAKVTQKVQVVARPDHRQPAGGTLLPTDEERAKPGLRTRST